MRGKNMNRFNSNRGFTLIESLISVAILGLAASMVSTVLLLNAKTQIQSQKKSDTTTYRSELKYKFRENIQSGAAVGKSQCRELMEGIVSGGQLYDLYNKANPSSPDFVKDYIVKLPVKDFVNNNPKFSYGDIKIKEMWLASPLTVAKGYGYKLSGGPAEILASKVFGATGNLYNTIVIKAELHIVFEKITNTPKPVVEDVEVFYMKPLSLNFAFKKSANVEEFIDCGTNSLAYSLANEYACNSLGVNFIYVTDNHNGANSGQCYMPIYEAPCDDTDYQCLQNYADANLVLTRPTKFRPLRMFFCEDVLKGIKLNQKFCTGANGV